MLFVFGKRAKQVLLPGVCLIRILLLSDRLIRTILYLLVFENGLMLTRSVTCTVKKPIHLIFLTSLIAIQFSHFSSNSLVRHILRTDSELVKAAC